MRELKDGWFNAAYSIRLADGREVVLKIAPPPGAEVMLYEQNIMATEVATMRAVRQNPAIPVPEIYSFDTAHDLCDSDYFFFFVQDGRVVGLIDFERALWAEPLMEAQFRSIFAGEGITTSIRGYGKTSFTVAEEQRCHLYSLHLALVMHTECYYRNYDTDAIFNFSRDYIGTAMAWLKAN